MAKLPFLQRRRTWNPSVLRHEPNERPAYRRGLQGAEPHASAEKDRDSADRTDGRYKQRPFAPLRSASNCGEIIGRRRSRGTACFERGAMPVRHGDRDERAVRARSHRRWVRALCPQRSDRMVPIWIPRGDALGGTCCASARAALRMSARLRLSALVMSRWASLRLMTKRVFSSPPAKRSKVGRMPYDWRSGKIQPLSRAGALWRGYG